MLSSIRRIFQKAPNAGRACDQKDSHSAAPAVKDSYRLPRGASIKSSPISPVQPHPIIPEAAWNRAADLFEKGTLLKRSGKYREAIAAFDECLVADPYHKPALIRKAASYYEMYDDRMTWECVQKSRSMPWPASHDDVMSAHFFYMRLAPRYAAL